MTVFVVDDNPSDVFLLEHALNAFGNPVQVDSFSSGRTALAHLREQSVPDLLILDFALPGENGLQILAKLRTDPNLRPMPAVLLSGGIPAGQQQEIDDQGALCLTKPFSLQGWMDLGSEIRELLVSPRTATAAA